jgi:hypothetical protein
MKRISLLLFAAAIAAPACSTGGGGGGNGGDDVSTTCGNGVCDPNETSSNCPADCTDTSGDQFTQALNNRVVDYNQALRIASLRLTGQLPSMADQAAINAAPDDASKATVYQNLIWNQTANTGYMTTPAFSQEMFYFWRDTFKQGETAVLDTAPAFAAEMTVNNSSYMDLFTKASANCPTFDGTSTFTDAECTNGGPKAGVLTNPGVMTQFFSNFAFRRTRWVQEVFDCTAFPAEVVAGIQVGSPTNAPYTNPWPFSSFAGTDNGGRVNFHDVSATICGDCHATINHIAPLFAYYDANGAYQTSIAVPTPLDGAPLAQMSDYLPSGQTTAWRLNVPAADIPSLGADMAADPAVASCGVARLWNFALGKTDIVDTLEIVPSDVIATQVAAFTQDGFKVKDLIFSIFTSDDFIKF